MNSQASPPWPAVEQLLTATWKRLAVAIPRAAAWGAVWPRMSRAWTEVDERGVAAHVGIIPTRVIAGGREHDVAAVHAVCTRPDRRGAGLATRLLRAALDDCEQTGLKSQVLFATRTPLYARQGFVARPRYTYGPRPWSGPHLPGEVTLSHLGSDEAVAAVLDGLRARAPSSRAFAVLQPPEMFALNLAIHGDAGLEIATLPALETIALYELRGTTLHLFELVTRRPELPPLDAVLQRLPPEFDAVSLDVHPGALAPGLELSLTERAGPRVDTMMVRGPLLRDLEDVATPYATFWSW